ncbi:hypothetical protein [uncultured Pseudoalteromonas sp.]|uniref:hypothetical protein n=1 Tax=uncultured Pseudoalteromonas sp. TaxID=114053 RepID=UPI002594FCA9|nr:hypothetical protein [uncultured Pseudoalteromonas sp.]
MKLPPKALLQTWYDLFKSNDPDLNEHGKQMLLNTFGCIAEVEAYGKAQGFIRGR